MKRTIIILLMLFVLFYVVIPQWGAQQDTARRLQQVNPLLLGLAVGLEIAALVAYAVLTRVTLPEKPPLGLWTVFRVQLATRAVTNVVPGGSAAGGTLGYRLFTQLGIPPTAAGFSMATVGLGSAVVLNGLLWVFLIISIPLNGFKAAYVTAALVGVLLLLAMHGFGFRWRRFLVRQGFLAVWLVFALLTAAAATCQWLLVSVLSLKVMPFTPVWFLAGLAVGGPGCEAPARLAVCGRSRQSRDPG